MWQWAQAQTVVNQLWSSCSPFSLTASQRDDLSPSLGQKDTKNAWWGCFCEHSHFRHKKSILSLLLPALIIDMMAGALSAIL